MYIDKILHADGSVTTIAGEELLPADPNRAKEYQTRAANADKWLHPDGSITDVAGHVILEADESRAQDYDSRMAIAVLMPGGNTDNSALHVFDDACLNTVSYPAVGGHIDREAQHE